MHTINNNIPDAEPLDNSSSKAQIEWHCLTLTLPIAVRSLEASLEFPLDCLEYGGSLGMVWDVFVITIKTNPSTYYEVSQDHY